LSYNARDWLSGDTYPPDVSTVTARLSPFAPDLPPETSGTDIYDFDERLILRTKADGLTINLGHDADGHRIAKTLLFLIATPVSTTTYLVDTNNHTGSAQVVEERVTTARPSPLAPDLRLAVYCFGTSRISQAVSLNSQPPILNCYGTGTDYQHAVFNVYPETLRTTPLWPALGNHDGKSANSIAQSGGYYDILTLPNLGQARGVPSGTEAYYSFDHANVHFICLGFHDSDRDAAGPMAQRLRADLAATTRDWIVAFFHHPTYTKGIRDYDGSLDSGGRMNDMRDNFPPIR